MTLTLIGLALAPGIAIILYIYWKDTHEKEPVHLLVKAFVLGVLSTFLTLLISWPIHQVVNIEERSIIDQLIQALVMVALVEEGSKFLFLRGFIFKNESFNEPFDGIVYAVMIGMGFATFENLFYVAEGGFEVALLRMFTAVPAHASFAILMGYFVGLDKFDGKRFTSILGLIVATLFHGAYDFFLFISFVPGIWSGAFISLFVAVFLSRKAIKVHQQASPFKERS